MKCVYGCGSKALYALKNGNRICRPSPNSCPVIKDKNHAGMIRSHAEGFGYTFTDEDRLSAYDATLNQIKSQPFYTWGKTLQRELVLQEQDNKCLCGINIWNGKSLVLELEHKDGDTYNNKRENLELLCPNCHSQTSTWRGRNNTGKKKVSDKKLMQALKESNNIRQALIKVNLAAKGGNYSRANRLLERMKYQKNT